MKARTKFLVGSTIIVVTLCMLAYVGFTQSKTYYHTISEVSTLQPAALHQRMRISGNVRAGSISHRDGGSISSSRKSTKPCPSATSAAILSPTRSKMARRRLWRGKSSPTAALSPSRYKRSAPRSIKPAQPRRLRSQVRGSLVNLSRAKQ